jgi:hypothetical protein
VKLRLNTKHTTKASRLFIRVNVESVSKVSVPIIKDWCDEG